MHIYLYMIEVLKIIETFYKKVIHIFEALEFAYFLNYNNANKTLLLFRYFCNVIRNGIYLFVQFSFINGSYNKLKNIVK
jgi:hypothetical protein